MPRISILLPVVALSASPQKDLIKEAILSRTSMSLGFNGFAEAAEYSEKLLPVDPAHAGVIFYAS